MLNRPQCCHQLLALKFHLDYLCVRTEAHGYGITGMQFFMPRHERTYMPTKPTRNADVTRANCHGNDVIGFYNPLNSIKSRDDRKNKYPIPDKTRARTAKRVNTN